MSRRIAEKNWQERAASPIFASRHRRAARCDRSLAGHSRLFALLEHACFPLPRFDKLARSIARDMA
jgi:hypothetical protein